jgi:hypothetical protein
MHKVSSSSPHQDQLNASKKEGPAGWLWWRSELQNSEQGGTTFPSDGNLNRNL